ncbi:nitrite reductase large subunit NirB [Rosettibacter firmus]|uniref:nitrite reductase large subunit NirB n=1 Tax=Rosettibacter firmus TaxID=3111522 RepID=UPI00336C1CAB
MNLITKDKPKIIIIGNGMVGYKFCEKLIEKSGKDYFDIKIFGEEPKLAYNRVNLTKYFYDKNEDDFILAPEEWYRENNIDVYINNPIISIIPEQKKVIDKYGNEYRYDKLILATGSTPFIPQIEGIEKEGIFVYRTITDLNNIVRYAENSRIGAVLGGGLLGLEAAKLLVDLGLETHVIEYSSRLMPRQLDSEGSKILKSKIESMNIKVHLGKSSKQIFGNGKVEKLVFTDETFLEADLLIVAAGIRPRDELARKAGLLVGKNGGIVVNDYLQTSNPDIYAIGECALHNNKIYGLVAPGYAMADVVASNIVGYDKKFVDYDIITKLKLLSIDVVSFGDAVDEKNNSYSVVYNNFYKGIYKRINISTDGKYLLGGILIGDIKDYNNLINLYKNKSIITGNPEDLILTNLLPKENSDKGISILSEDAIVCSCEGIPKNKICNAILEYNLTDVNSIKKITKAGTGCGGCTPVLNDLLNMTLKQIGIERKKILCEHFKYSRQELFHIIKINRIKTFDELIKKYGSGTGCEICKPAIASILASLWNENILSEKNRHLQDTNDRFLANIQRGGTYSVVPRIPGGEITPDKLIILGKIAKKYNLYCKITGGQRIDMFGAHLNDLPLIWKELIDAGFESGHAYAKAVRTVKSCVGSTWCRFGVQDSVSFAIKIENRYKGIRAPHKIKGGVSGCIRECAEAQAKDFGIIATEKGWNLYVCGNGGAKPQHAVLLAADLDENTCIKYLDRFLMFYIRTADPLTRTATWLNNLEGGIDYLKDVIINDTLGFCEELEKEMQSLIDSYKCEWKEAIENENIKKHFKQFYNSDEKDPTLVFKEVRQQKIPEGWGNIYSMEKFEV